MSAVGESQRLGPIGRSWRVALVLALAVLFGLGSAIGDDHWWPFGPWRMFSTSTNPDRAVVSTIIEVRTEDAPREWMPGSLNLRTVGLNRAEVEGRLDLIRADPALLSTLAATRERLRPDEPRWTAIRVVFERTHLQGGKPTGEVSREVVATWDSSDRASGP
ncbi:MAG: hypothetical protein ABR500_07575 [Dermatophilaceae bacterium]|nr:hypothetical protein [Intrasporangiaceae bacterium]